MSGFWAWIYTLQHLGTCTAWGTNGTGTVYGGNCVQAWLLSVASHGAVGWGRLFLF